ncbi:uncharacterized protein LOC127537124 [Acanthochromis polyacanthus]|uniref:uncharacterized protein LOC127537124 n=1 Tax=Acanthochromis polyacanthus TaxID=80966 RepID=UPI002234397B|nr:uncharacterized protein LOC127537124 [Acanthochromis polyacanthus]
MGRSVKKRIIQKVLVCEKKTLLIPNFYKTVLPLLKSYVCLFQSSAPLVHKLHEKQEALMRQFLSSYVRQEQIETGSKLLKQELAEDVGQFMNKGSLLYGGQQTKDLIMQCRKDDTMVAQFKENVFKAYRDTGVYLQKKLPLGNELLRALVYVDPLMQNRHSAQMKLEKLPKYLPKLLSVQEQDNFYLEVRRYLVDKTLPHYEEEKMTLDQWWTKVQKKGQYPNLCKVVLAMCTIFHGPHVESSFNIMEDIVNVRSTRIGTDLYNAYQTVKYHLRAHKKSAVEYFKRSDVEFDPVDPKLVSNMTSASAERPAYVPSDKSMPESKAATKRRMDAEARDDRLLFVKEKADEPPAKMAKLSEPATDSDKRKNALDLLLQKRKEKQQRK